MGCPCEDDDARSDGDTFRAEMAVAFAKALREAEDARVVSASTKSPTTMAANAYENLCFDFPLVDTVALDALGLVIKSNLAVTGRMSFSITPRFVAGLSHLARPAAPSQRGEDSEPVVDDSHSRDKGSVSNQSVALATILSCVLVVAPSHALATTVTDNGPALRALLGTYRSAASAAGVTQDPASETIAQAREAPTEDNDRSDPLPEDDDSDWEPLEEGPSAAKPSYPDPLLAPPDDGQSLTWQDLIGRLADLASHIRYEALSYSNVWADPTLRLVPATLDLVAGLQACGRHYKVDVTAAVRPYLALLVDRMAADPGCGGSDSIASVVPRVLTTLTSPKPGDPSLAPAFLSTLVARLAARPTAHPLLWPAVQEALPLLASQAQTVLGTSAAERNHDWLAEVEALMLVLTFYVEAAPGNADIGPPLMQSGIWRDSLALFAAAGPAPPAEHLRRFLLLACAASPAVARFAAAVPPFLATTRSEAFLDPRGPASLHAATWPLVLPRVVQSPAEAEERAAAIVREPGRAWSGSGDPDAIALAGALGRLHRFLSLLQAVAHAAAAGRAVWTKGGPLEKALNECAARLRSAKTSAAGIRPTESGESVSEAGLPDERITEAVESAHLTEAVSKATSSNELDERRIEAVESADKSPRIQEEIQVTNGESQTMGGTQLRSAGRQAPEDERSTAEDKVQELLPVLLKQLKGISDQSKGAGAVGKND